MSFLLSDILGEEYSDRQALQILSDAFLQYSQMLDEDERVSYECALHDCIQSAMEGIEPEGKRGDATQSGPQNHGYVAVERLPGEPILIDPNETYVLSQRVYTKRMDDIRKELRVSTAQKETAAKQPQRPIEAIMPPISDETDNLDDEDEVEMPLSSLLDFATTQGVVRANEPKGVEKPAYDIGVSIFGPDEEMEEEGGAYEADMPEGGQSKGVPEEEGAEVYEAQYEDEYTEYDGYEDIPDYGAGEEDAPEGLDEIYDEDEDEDEAVSPIVAVRSETKPQHLKEGGGVQQSQAKEKESEATKEKESAIDIMISEASSREPRTPTQEKAPANNTPEKGRGLDYIYSYDDDDDGDVEVAKTRLEDIEKG